MGFINFFPIFLFTESESCSQNLHTHTLVVVSSSRDLRAGGPARDATRARGSFICTQHTQHNPNQTLRAENATAVYMPGTSHISHEECEMGSQARSEGGGDADSSSGHQMRAPRTAGRKPKFQRFVNEESGELRTEPTEPHSGRHSASKVLSRKMDISMYCLSLAFIVTGILLLLHERDFKPVQPWYGSERPSHSSMLADTLSPAEEASLSMPSPPRLQGPAPPPPVGPLAQAASRAVLMPYPPPPPPGVHESRTSPSPPVRHGNELWRRFGASPEEAADTLVREHLTVEEKAGLLQGYGWNGYTQEDGHYSGNVRGISRLRIPSINMQDAGQGFRTSPEDIIGTVTSFPSALTASASWDRGLVRRYAAAIGREFKAKGANVVLGPSVNLHRVPRNGRNAEYLTGEDPYLGAALASRYVQGVQSEGVAACVKHYAANNQETRREETSAEIESERILFEVYYPPFAAAVDAGAAAVMCSYNKVNGDYACGGDPRLITKHLRAKMGFKGFVMSDWWATHDTWASKNGLDQEMPGSSAGNRRGGLFDRWKLEDENADLDSMARHVLIGMLGSSAWDRGPHCTPGQNCSFLLYQRDATSSEHDELAREVARSGAILLKNENGALPLRRGMQVALVGSACSADFAEPWQQWNTGDYYTIGGSGRVLAESQDRWDVERGLSEAKDRGEISELVVRRGDDVDDAIDAMRNVDVVIACGGARSTEGTDRASLELDQHEFLVNLARRRSEVDDRELPPLVTVALAPGAIMTREWEAGSNSILLVFLSGQATGLAVADLLLGRVSPSGKLPLTIPQVEGGAPEPCWDDHCQYREGLSVGWKALSGRDVSYAFGHGLTYTQFAYSWASDSSPTLASGDVSSAPLKTLSVTVTNVGDATAAEVAQLYLGFPASSGEPPLLLRGFEKTAALLPGEAAIVHFQLFARDLSVWDETREDWARVHGSFTAHASAASNDHRLSLTFDM